MFANIIRQVAKRESRHKAVGISCVCVDYVTEEEESRERMNMMHVPFKRRYEIQAVIHEAENDVAWLLRAGCEKIVISRGMTRSCITNTRCYDIGAQET